MTTETKQQCDYVPLGTTCSEMFNCCSCGVKTDEDGYKDEGCDCAYCFDCNCCEVCENDDE